MVQKNRRERRAGNRQPKIAAVLMVAVAILSFGIGFMAGRNSVDPMPVVAVSSTPLQPVPMPKTDPSIEVIEEKVEEEKLTFFDTLPKGEQTPLGSGINVAPEETDPVAAKIAQQTLDVAPSPAPVKPAPPKEVVAPKPVVRPPTKAVASANVPHVLQISSFRSPDEAGILVRRLEKKGYQPYIQQADLGSKGIWFRVFLGPYASKEKAKTAAIRLKTDEKLESLVRRK